MSSRFHLKCLECDEVYDDKIQLSQCAKCGGILEYRLIHSYEKIKFKGPFNFWRYKPVLPDVGDPVSLGEGGTPLQKAQRLADLYRISNLYLKDETRNPTSSFKDRSAALIVSKAVDEGYDSIVCATNGNHGASIAAYAAKVDIQCHLIVPKAVDIGKLAQMMVYDAKIVEAGESIEEAINRAKYMEEEMGWYQATTELNPLAVEGLKTISYELVEQNGVPDFIILAMGSGATLHAVWKGFQEMKELKIIENHPKIIGIQSEGCSPITDAFYGKEKIKSNKISTEAIAIRVAEPIYGKLALDALKESGGFAVNVSDNDMISAGKEIARLEGIFAEPASAAPVASLKLEVVKRQIIPSKNIVCLVTSSGLKTDDILRSLTKHKKSPRIGSRFTTKERILRIINQGPTYGYAIWKNLKGEMTLGAVYQHLTDLEKRGLVSSKVEGKRKILEITSRGKRVLNSLDDLQILL
jgi:threonine synthase